MKIIAQALLLVYSMFMASSSSTWMQSAVIPSHKGLFGAKAKKAGMSTRSYAQDKQNSKGTLGKEARLALTFEKTSPKKWTESSDDKYDKSHGIKDNSPKDMKLDKKRGLKSDTLKSSLMKLRGGK